MTTTEFGDSDDVAWHLFRMLDEAPDWPAIEAKIPGGVAGIVVPVYAVSYLPDTNRVQMHVSLPAMASVLVDLQEGGGGT